MSFNISVQGLDTLLPKIRSLPDEAKKQVINDIDAYSLEVIKKEPPNKFVTRKAAYGKSAFSPAQQRYIGWLYSEGKVPYRRTHELSNSWRSTRSEGGVIFSNNAPGAYYVMGIQSAHEKMVGWKSVYNIVTNELSFRSSKFRNACMAAVQKSIRKLNLG